MQTLPGVPWCRPHKGDRTILRRCPSLDHHNRCCYDTKKTILWQETFLKMREKRKKRRFASAFAGVQAAVQSIISGCKMHPGNHAGATGFQCRSRLFFTSGNGILMWKKIIKTMDFLPCNPKLRNSWWMYPAEYGKFESPNKRS